MTVHEITVKHNLGFSQKIVKVDDSQLRHVTHNLNLEHTVTVEAYWSPTFIPLPPHHTRWTDHTVQDVRNGIDLTFGMLCGEYTTSEREDVYNFDPNVLPADPPFGSAPYDHRQELPQFFPSQTKYQYLPTNYFTEYHWWLDRLCELYGWDKLPTFTIQGQPGQFLDLHPVSCYLPQMLDINDELVPDVSGGGLHRDPDTGEAYETVLRPLSEFELLNFYTHHKAYLGQLMYRLHDMFTTHLRFIHPTTSAMFNIFNTNIRTYSNSGKPTEFVREQCFPVRLGRNPRMSTGWWTPRLDTVGQHGKLSRHDYVRLLPKRMTIFSYDGNGSLFSGSNSGNAVLNEATSCPSRGFSIVENFMMSEGSYEETPVIFAWPYPVVPVTDPNIWHFPSLQYMQQTNYFDEFRTVVVTQVTGGPNTISNESSWFPITNYSGGDLKAALAQSGYTGDSFREWRAGPTYPGRLNSRSTGDLYASKVIYFGELEDGNQHAAGVGDLVAGDQIVSVQTRSVTVNVNPNGTYNPFPPVKIPETFDLGSSFNGETCPTLAYGNLSFRRTQAIIGGGGGFYQYGLDFNYRMLHVRRAFEPLNTFSFKYSKPKGTFNYWPLNGRTFREAFGVFPAVNTVTLRENATFTYCDPVNMRIISPRNPFIGYKVVAFCTNDTLHSTGQVTPSESTQLVNGLENYPIGYETELKARKLYDNSIAGAVIYEKDFTYSEYGPYMVPNNFASTMQRDIDVDISALYELFDTPCNSFCIALLPKFSIGDPDWNFYDMMKEGAEEGEGYSSLYVSTVTVDTFLSSTLQASENISIAISSRPQGSLSPIPGGHLNPLTEDARRYRFYCEIGPFRIPCLMPMYKVSG